ncbi:hypothetical protein ACIBTP_39585 [Streptomyces avidinii]|uniref:hypothetical protein n=1 Tax=Streptomyces TaxID=1883 RepID=UPI0020B1B4AD|nr:hypothetical protein [Streptomyces sp. ADI95-16]
MIWSTLAVQAFARGLMVENCGRFGGYLPQGLSWFVLAQDALLLLYATLLLHGVRRARPAPAITAHHSGDAEHHERRGPTR